MRKIRIIGMIGGGVALALLLFGGVSLSQRLDQDVSNLSDQSEPAAASLTPVSFTRVSETQTEAGAILRLSGVSEPFSIISLRDRGEAVRQVRTSAQGVWSAQIPVTGQGMAIEAIMYDMGDAASEGDVMNDFSTQAATSIRGVETIFRIQRVTEAEPNNPSLIMITAPGAPTRLVQSPFGGLPSSGPLAISSIDYDDAGGVIFSGVSERQGRIRLSLSNAEIGETRVGPDGRWTYIASSVMPLGEYEVRAQLIDDETGAGPTVSVFFERLPPLLELDGSDATLSVNFEPFRWQIRRSLVGGGLQNTAIFAPE